LILVIEELEKELARLSEAEDERIDALHSASPVHPLIECFAHRSLEDSE
jgi:hypothetical protein